MVEKTRDCIANICTTVNEEECLLSVIERESQVELIPR